MIVSKYHQILTQFSLPGVLMARWKTSATGGPVPRAEVTGGACAAHVSRLAAAALVRAGAPAHCFRVLSALLPYWKEKTSGKYNKSFP